ncbi:enoyl-ACP reductase [Novosphingobium sp. PC22D]|uniref:enoyl-ACP reductase FabI n=1 Tax=Novosphingobium sp. PC22D TaxID=1962403 RepID=UPI000BF06AC7|nr:SDR family oxidoreductase [Novosphingobium sp. PC22D]PEQ13864.1 enoyl-ACP reductase [Novosphingobium sp. PC22D]
MASDGLALSGKKGLIIGLADARSIAWGCARVLHDCGTQFALTCVNEKARAAVQPLADELESELAILDFREEGALEAVVGSLAERWGGIDFVIHSAAFAPPDALGDLIDCPAESFAQALDLSCHSFVRTARAVRPIMNAGGSLIAMSYLGGARVVDGYAVMGCAKAALEMAVKVLAHELGPTAVRVNAVSPGPIMTRAAGGLHHFDEIVAHASERSPLKREVTVEDVGWLTAFLISDRSGAMTGDTHYVDAGVNIMG